MAQRSPYDDSKISPEIIRLAVMMYSRFPLPAGSMDARLDTADICDGLTDAHELRSYGEKGAYGPSTMNVQDPEIFAAKRPTDDLAPWGCEPMPVWGTLCSEAGPACLPSQKGRDHECLKVFGTAVRAGARLPATGTKGACTLALLDVAHKSAAEGQFILLGALGPRETEKGHEAC